MLQVVNISKSYSSEIVLERVSFVVNPGERAGLIGPNGSGKSTLLRIVAGVERADSGRVVLGSGSSSAWLPQGFEVDSARTLGEVMRRALADHTRAQETLLKIEKQMTRAAGTELSKLIEEYGRVSDRFEALGGYDVERHIGAVLQGLGLADIPDDTPLSILSGGQRTRTGLASIIATSPDILLLDEPTNHLDIEGLEWLEQYLSLYMGAAVIVSHDRTLLDSTATRILELDGESPTLSTYWGNFSDYRASKERQLEKQTAAWKDQEAEKKRIQQDVSRTKQFALRTETSTTHDFYRRRAKNVARKAKVRERRLQRVLSSSDRVKRPKEAWKMNLDFGSAPRGGSQVLLLKDVGQISNGRWLFRDVNLTIGHRERIALLGSNGSGKSTLIRLVMGHLSPTKGSVQVGANIRAGYMPQDQAGLDWSMSALEMIRQAKDMTETEARTFLHLYLFEGDEPLLPAGSLSYGQRSRLLLAKLVLEGANFLVLDEPMNHLDISSMERFEEALEAFHGTVLMAVHDRTFLDRYATALWNLEDGTIRRYADRREIRQGRDHSNRTDDGMLR